MKTNLCAENYKKRQKIEMALGLATIVGTTSPIISSISLPLINNSTGHH
jgi:hypothetical protein